MGNKVQVKDNDTYHVVYTYAGDVTKVDIYHKKLGIHARGNARRYHTDPYDYSVGQQLAYLRALERVAHKAIRKILPKGE